MNKKDKTINHRDTEAQRKAREVKVLSGFLAFDFLCVSVPLWPMVFVARPRTGMKANWNQKPNLPIGFSDP
jgi:hypothetical protein